MIDYFAGILGVNPDPFTLRELTQMVKARGEFEWEQTSSLMALVINVIRNPKKSKPTNPNDLNPYKTKEKSLPIVPLSILKEIWCKHSPD